MAGFIWDDKNAEHATSHGVSIEEIEYVVLNARRPWPEPYGADKFRVWGRTEAGEFVQVVYVLESDAVEVDYTEIDLLALDEGAEAIYVIHAMPLTEDMKKQYRKRTGRKGGKR